MTATDVIARIQHSVGIPWMAKTVDKVIAGSPATSVRGIAVTMMATLEALRASVDAACNMVVTHEPTFYTHEDDTAPLLNDSTYLVKDRFIRTHDLVVFRFHDHWHAMTPDGIDWGMMQLLGWQKYARVDSLTDFTFPEVRLDRFVATMSARLGVHSMRIVGDAGLLIRRVATSWGYAAFDAELRGIVEDDGIDVLIVGETREWELVEYVQDRIAAGKHTALIIVGHVASEQAGVRYCAEWLRKKLPEVPVKFVPIQEPFWVPGR